ncbi:hypothetical protein TSOC_004893 [Tetrabaena socialis]|uniref:Uncharacterized protein n=1 Tax=Tetrabaena socialis TaxID=47790 RepID=A0A2J8A7M1_9CHLO|nr:hypothetical protein TSOC_004893 [Tetrabaena socialis]|eukprot:PNH08546.1 hypothetical protein TSOC_004893 [Tetrabaena socialis]
MANNLTRGLHLRSTGSNATAAGTAAAAAAAAAAPALTGSLYPPLHPHALGGDDLTGQLLPPYHLLSSHHHLPSYATSSTPPGGASPQRTVVSGMSEGLDPDPYPEVGPPQAMQVSNALGRASALTADPASETAESEQLDERERQDSLGALPPTAWAGLAGLGSPPGRAGGAAAPTDLVPNPLAPSGASVSAAASPLALALMQRRLSDAHGAGSPYGGSGLGSQSPGVGGGVPRGSPYLGSGGGRGGLLPRGPLADVPTSPSDSRWGGLDLRKTALLRSLSRRAEEPCASDGMGGGGGGGGGEGCGAGPGQEAHAALDGAAAAPVGAGAGGLQLRGCSPMRAVSRSDSALSDGMSEGGCGGGGGCCLGPGAALPAAMAAPRPGQELHYPQGGGGSGAFGGGGGVGLFAGGAAAAAVAVVGAVGSPGIVAQAMPLLVPLPLSLPGLQVPPRPPLR